MNEKLNNIKEMVVVEGVHDAQKLESIYPSIHCIITGGSRISQSTIHLIQKASLSRGVILMLDPDHPGRKLEHTIIQHVQTAKVAYLHRHEATSRNRRKVGVEHADASSIDRALSHLFTYTSAYQDEICASDLYTRGLSGSRQAAHKRHRAANNLGLPPTNTKTFLKNLNGFQIKLSELDAAIR